MRFIFLQLKGKHFNLILKGLANYLKILILRD